MISWGVYFQSTSSNQIFGVLYNIYEDCQVTQMFSPLNMTSNLYFGQAIDPHLISLNNVFVLSFQGTHQILTNLFNSSDGTLMNQFPILIVEDSQIYSNGFYQPSTYLASVNNYDTFIVGWISQFNLTAGTSNVYVSIYNISSMSFINNSPILISNETFAFYISLAVTQSTNTFMVALGVQTHLENYYSYGVIGRLNDNEVQADPPFLIFQNQTVYPSVVTLGDLFLMVSTAVGSQDITGALYNSISGTNFQGPFIFNKYLNNTIESKPVIVQAFSYDYEQKFLLSWNGEEESIRQDYTSFFQLSQLQCKSNVDCYQSEMSYCEINSSTCVQCLTNEECPFYQPSCSQEYRCFKCTSNEECANSLFGKICYKGKCSECFSNNDCPSSNPVCIANTCSGCQQNSDCLGSENLKTCYQSACYECLNNNECPLNEVCDSSFSCAPSGSSQRERIFILVAILEIIIIFVIFVIQKIREELKNKNILKKQLYRSQQSDNNEVRSQRILSRSNPMFNSKAVYPENISNFRESDSKIELRIHDDKKNETDCVICLVKVGFWAPNPCGHLCLCEDCQKDIMNTTKLCPLCRKEADSMIRTYSQDFQINIVLQVQLNYLNSTFY